MTDFFVKMIGTFFVAGITAAAGALIEEVQNFGKEKVRTKPLLTQDWKHYINFGNNQRPASTYTSAPQTTYSPPVTSTRPTYSPPPIPSSSPPVRSYQAPDIYRA